MKNARSILLVAVVIALSACTTMKTNNIREVNAKDVKGCKLLGDANGADATFVGLSASIGSKNAKAKAMNAAVQLGATDVVWTQSGTSMTNEWLGKAYRCK